MAYLGVQPTAGQYRKLDDISGSFNGSTVTFTTQVGGQNVTAGSAQSILVSLGGVIQSPGTNYSVSTNSITFVTAPAAGLSFFAILLGEAVNTGTPSDGTVTPAKLSTGGPSWDSTGNVVLQTAGTTAAPAIQATGDSNTGIYFPAADNIGFTTGGTIRGRWTTNGLCFNTDTAAANALDDYEEGSWTPTVGQRSGATYTKQQGVYTKVGQFVSASFYIILSNGGTPGTWLTIENLPFAPQGGLDQHGILSGVGYSGLGTNVAIITGGWTYNNSSSAYVIGRTAASTSSAADIIPANYAGNSLEIFGTLNYRV